MVKKQVSSLNYECKPLQWDTDYFGVRSARVNLYGSVNESGQEDIIKYCRQYDFITIANFNNIAENNHWIGAKTNAFLVDVNIQFLKVIIDKTDYQKENIYVLNNYPRTEQIVNIASKSFQFSRFFNDPRLPEMQAKNIYSHWTQCAFEQENKYFVVCKKKGNIAGYILFSINENGSMIELIAVDGKYHGLGVGKSMIQAMGSFVIDHGINKIKVGTQVNNTSAAQFYSKLGFTYISCGSVYHLWWNNKF